MYVPMARACHITRPPRRRARAAARFIAPHEQDEHAREDRLEVDEEVDRVLEVVVLAHLTSIIFCVSCVYKVERPRPPYRETLCSSGTAEVTGTKRGQAHAAKHEHAALGLGLG